MYLSISISNTSLGNLPYGLHLLDITVCTTLLVLLWHNLKIEDTENRTSQVNAASYEVEHKRGYQISEACCDFHYLNGYC